MNLLVTGVAGFIGSHLAERLLERGDRVFGLDNFDPFYDRALKEANLAAIRPHIVLIEGDILDDAALDRALSRCRIDAIVHLAALAGVRPSVLHPERYHHVNVDGTGHVADAAHRHSVPCVVFASSSSVYGDGGAPAPGVPLTAPARPSLETDYADAPLSPYAASKRSAELLLRWAYPTRRLDVTALRYFTVYGPRQRPDMAVSSFARAIARGDEVTLFGGDTTSRDYTYIDDIVEGTLRALDAAVARGAAPGFRIYNLGSGRTVPLAALVAALGEALGRTPRVAHAPAPPGEVRATLASIDAARLDLGYEPRTSLDEGIRSFVRWLSAG